MVRTVQTKIALEEVCAPQTYSTLHVTMSAHPHRRMRHALEFSNSRRGARGLVAWLWAGVFAHGARRGGVVGAR